jgi:hypothetical protein
MGSFRKIRSTDEISLVGSNNLWIYKFQKTVCWLQGADPGSYFKTFIWKSWFKIFNQVILLYILQAPYLTKLELHYIFLNLKLFLDQIHLNYITASISHGKYKSYFYGLTLNPYYRKRMSACDNIIL